MHERFFLFRPVISQYGFACPEGLFQGAFPSQLPPGWFQCGPRISHSRYSLQGLLSSLVNGIEISVLSVSMYVVATISMFIPDPCKCCLLGAPRGEASYSPLYAIIIEPRVYAGGTGPAILGRKGWVFEGMLRGRQGQKCGGREMERQCLNMGIINAFTTYGGQQ